MKNYLTAIVITKNEEVNIGRCLSSVKFADEIIVVDSGSTDKTVTIAKRFNAKVYGRKFDDYAAQRNFAVSKASGEWILSLDADEEITEALAKEIREVINKDDYDGYLIPRKNIIFGKEIKYTRWSPDKHIWLFNKRKGSFKSSIHEEVELKGKVGELKNAKIHHSHKNVFDFIAMTNSYTSYEANEKIKRDSFSYFKLLYVQ